MCGIAGILYLDQKIEKKFSDHAQVLKTLAHRGPDHQNYSLIDNGMLFHTRLSILDISPASNQPFIKNKNHLCFNGELFNYKALKQNLGKVETTGDVEVMHRLLETQNDLKFLNSINGFFAFAFYNETLKELTIGRDRLGIKPLYYYKDEEKFCFASELKPLLEMCGPQEINHEQLYSYLRLNYCAGNESIFKNVHQLEPGHYIKIKNGKITKENWFEEKKSKNTEDLFELMNDAVNLRLNADVPVGSFLSGGIDSSIISALAKQHHKNIHTFSIGFKDEPFFDETDTARSVAKHIGSNHHEFKLSNTDFLDNIHPFLNSIDEPFADSSALNVYILCQLTKKHVKVALSGDGADELFKGYNKHKAILLAKSRTSKILTAAMHPLTNLIPKSRHGKLQNQSRKIDKFKKLIGHSDKVKQQFLAQLCDGQEANALLKKRESSAYFNSLFKHSKIFHSFPLEDTFDIEIVLKDDMLVKADRFSMFNGLEIRSPFLDYRIVNYALNLDKKEKINRNEQKIILRKKFEHLLPKEVFTRKKKGFELPLWKWLNTELRFEIENKWLSKAFVTTQGLFNYNEVELLKSKLFSKNPGDSAARVWALIVFQNWYIQNKKHIA
ncbi:MAG: asparagine synthase (glutamine-hydrolyzing) [Bacteroidota bacterium]|nr:asparagine synthase (glutamine-hydrolyzing) [Bacteroidota bacterium]